MSQFTDVAHPCPFCGGNEFVAGHLKEEGAIWIWFETDDRSFSDRLSGVNKADIRVRACLACRHCDLFVPDLVLD